MPHQILPSNNCDKGPSEAYISSATGSKRQKVSAIDVSIQNWDYGPWLVDWVPSGNAKKYDETTKFTKNNKKKAMLRKRVTSTPKDAIQAVRLEDVRATQKAARAARAHRRRTAMHAQSNDHA